MLCDGGRNAVGLRSKHSLCYWRLCLVALRQIYSHVGCQIWLHCLIDIKGGSQNVTRHLETALPACSHYCPEPGQRWRPRIRYAAACKCNRVSLGSSLHSQLECGPKERVLQFHARSPTTDRESSTTASAPETSKVAIHLKVVAAGGCSGFEAICKESGYRQPVSQLPRKNFLFHVIPTNRAKTICRYQNLTDRILLQPNCMAGCSGEDRVNRRPLFPHPRAVVRSQNAFSHQTKFYPASISNLDCRPTRRISTRAEARRPLLDFLQGRPVLYSKDLMELHIEAVSSILVAKYRNRDLTLWLVFELNGLILS